MSPSSSENSPGPWIYKDPDGRKYLIQIVPMEYDPTVDEGLQPKAVVFQTEEGWIRLSPVGHDFSLSDLSQSEVLKLLRHAAGKPVEESGEQTREL